MRLVVALAVLALAGRAGADPEADADRAFREAMRRAVAAEPGALDAFEQLGAREPATRWSDDAWAEAARLAERAGDFARARRAHERVIALEGDEVLVRRSRAALARLAAATAGGRWDDAARAHERLVSEIFDGGDPRDALAALERLVREQPGYPRAASVWLVLGQAWEREGEADRAIELLREGQPSDPPRLGLALARALIRRGELAGARTELDRLAAAPGADRAAIAEVRERLAVAEQRAWIRRVLGLALALGALAAAVALRRAAGSWRAAGRALGRPPIEVLFLIPVGAVLVAVAQTGNPLVARALLGITLAGIAVAWISGVLLDLARGRLRAGRVVVHAALAVAAIGAAAYLAIDRDRMLDLVEETVQHGPVPR